MLLNSPSLIQTSQNLQKIALKKYLFVKEPLKSPKNYYLSPEKNELNISINNNIHTLKFDSLLTDLKAQKQLS